MIHQLVAQDVRTVTVMCGAKVTRQEASIWWSDVTCTKCHPHQWVKDPHGPGRKLVRVGSEPEPKRAIPTKVWKRRSP